MVKVKICGITNIDDAVMCSQEGADALGFIFSRKSPRYISEKAAKKIIRALGPLVIKTGVFVDEDKDRVSEIADSLGLDALQFHGKEPASYCRFFKRKYRVIKVFFPQDRPFKERITSYKVDAFLFDMKYEQKVKGKKALPKSILKRIQPLIKEGYRVIISGGLNADNVSGVKKLCPYAVDVASGVETFLGRKDKQLVRLFIRKAKCSS